MNDQILVRFFSLKAIWKKNWLACDWTTLVTWKNVQKERDDQSIVDICVCLWNWWDTVHKVKGKFLIIISIIVTSVSKYCYLNQEELNGWFLEVIYYSVSTQQRATKYIWTAQCVYRRIKINMLAKNTRARVNCWM